MSLPVSELIKPRQLRRALEALAVTLDGSAAAPTTVRRKRAVFNGALQYAVEIEALPANNLSRVGWRPPTTSDVVDRRVVINPVKHANCLPPSPTSVRSTAAATYADSSPSSITPAPARPKSKHCA